MKRVLFISSTRIGDAIINSGVLNHLVETMPDAKFTIACGHLAEPIYMAVPRLERMIIMRKKPNGGHWFDLWKQVVGTRWDLVVDMRSSGTSYVLNTGKRGILSQSNKLEHKVYESASALSLSPPPTPKIHLSKEALEKADVLLPKGRDILALCPAASLIFKMWPSDRYAELVKRLISKDGAMAGAMVVVFGGPGDEEAAVPVNAAIAKDDILDFTDKLSLDIVAACMSRARLFIGNDSGLMHMAAAVDIPTLGLFGPSDERQYGPYGPKCDVVRGVTSFADIQVAHPKWKAHPTSLLADLSVDAALAGAEKLLERTKS